MRSSVQRENPLPVLGSMVWIALGSFVAGFAGFLVVGLMFGG